MHRPTIKTQFKHALHSAADRCRGVSDPVCRAIGRGGRRRVHGRQGHATDTQGRAPGHRGVAGRDGRAPMSQQRRAPSVPVLVDETGPDHRARYRAQ